MNNEQLPPIVTEQEKTWATIVHIAGFFGYIMPALGAVLGPLLVWLLKKEGMPFVEEQGREAINFNITCLLASLVCLPLCMVVIGYPLLLIVGGYWLIFTIIAAIKVNRGEAYKHPFVLRLIRK